MEEDGGRRRKRETANLERCLANRATTKIPSLVSFPSEREREREREREKRVRN